MYVCLVYFVYCECNVLVINSLIHKLPYPQEVNADRVLDPSCVAPLVVCGVCADAWGSSHHWSGIFSAFNLANNKETEFDDYG